ncbi:DUF7344 domain-containing protein [Halapricum salinum]|uniref:DUF7344 domain-containing protein n=1 Tax=Halapricum salinum TaxID=1457250 RepID=UPI0010A518E2|nr:hypothetical protein [Halapricum salinum]
MAQSVPDGHADDETDVETDSVVSRDDLFEMLGNDRRRRALEIVMEREGGVSVTELVEEVAAQEYDKPVDELSRSERKAVYTAVVQRHLPKLEDRGLIARDHEAGEVVPSETLVDLNIYFEISGDGRFPFSVYYVGLSGLGIVLLLAASFGLEPVDAFSPVTWLSITLGILGVTALVHLHRMRRMRVDPTGSEDVEKETDDRVVLSVLASGIAATAGGLVGGAAMWVILHHVMFFTPVIMAVYGFETSDPTILAHLGHSLVFAAVFAALLTREQFRLVSQTVGETVALGMLYGVGLWFVAEGVVVPAISGVVLATQFEVFGVDVLYLPLDGLSAHVIFGALLGGVYTYTRQRLEGSIEG